MKRGFDKPPVLALPHPRPATVGKPPAARRRARRRASGLALGLALGVVGCAAPTPPLYDWGAFPAATHRYLKGDGFDARTSLDELERQLSRTLAAGRVPPPGLHAHLALLYAQLGDEAGARSHLLREKERFPEAQVHVDFLLRQAQAGGEAPGRAAAAGTTGAEAP